jgi:hypothetical protein
MLLVPVDGGAVVAVKEGGALIPQWLIEPSFKQTPCMETTCPPFGRVSARAMPFRAIHHVPGSIPVPGMVIARGVAMRRPPCSCLTGSEWRILEVATNGRLGIDKWSLGDGRWKRETACEIRGDK